MGKELKKKPTKKAPAKSDKSTFFKPAVAQPEKKESGAELKASSIMTMDNYLDNSIQEVEFYFSELAIIRFLDGTELRLGLVDRYMNPPVESVDYRTQYHEYSFFGDAPTGSDLQYRVPGDMPKLTEANKSMPFGELMRMGSESVSFKYDPGCDKILPTVINALTAPQLCNILLDLEAQYIQSFDMSLEMMEAFVLMFASYYGSMSFANEGEALLVNRAARNKSGTLAYQLVQQTDNFLLNKFDELLTSGATGSFVINKVKFSGVELFNQGTELLLHYGGINRLPGGIKGAGKAMHLALEKNIKNLSTSMGLANAKLRVYLVQNSNFRDWLISQGYAEVWRDVVISGVTSFTKVYEKVL